MRFPVLLACLTLVACVAGGGGGGVTSTLTPTDAATSLIAGGPLQMTLRSSESSGGEDPLVLLTLRHADGRSMSFNENNHAPNHVMAQSAGGPLAQVMGLFGEEAPKLYGARAEENSGAPFICPPGGPVSIGYYETADGTVSIIGMRREIEFETMPDGTQNPLPFSPDQVCARLNFRRG